MSEHTFSAPPGFTVIQANAARVLVREGYEAHLPLLCGWSVPASVEWVGGGRAAHPLVDLDGTGERALVRSYRRGGFIRHVNPRHYFLGNRAFEELRATERARGGGVRVPLVLAAAQRRAGIGYTATLATVWLDGVTGARPWIARPDGERGAILHLIGEQIGRMHRAGIAHPDLNLTNVLVSRAGAEVTLVDFDRAAISDGPAPRRARARNILRFARSARRLGVALDERMWEALRSGYGPDWPFTDRLP